MSAVTRKTSILALGATVVALAWQSPASGVAADEGDCSACNPAAYCGVNESGTQHRFAGAGTCFHCGSSGTGTCHDDWYNLECDADQLPGHGTHTNCKQTGPSLEEVIAAVRDADVATTKAWLEEPNTRVQLNHARGILQILHCDSRVIANVPVTGELLEALEQDETVR
ncbi:MAG TPA: hypothetical protein VJL28_07295 [Gemmatimonadaceae bacterium]|nr:hypothetical protein [Gemmatimonadaceae bacterium]